MTIPFNGARVRFRRLWAQPGKFLTGSQSHGSVRWRTRECRRNTQSMLEARRNSTWEEKWRQILIWGTKMRKAQVQKVFNRSLRRAAWLCWGSWILNIPHMSYSSQLHATPGTLRLVPHLASLPGFPFFLELLWRNKTLTEEHGRPGSMENAARQWEGQTHPSFSACPGSIPLISSHWAGLRE